MAVNNQSRYPLSLPSPKKRRFPVAVTTASAGIVVIVAIFLIPQLITLEIKQEQTHPIEIGQAEPFPVSVNPITKSIVDNPQADALFASKSSELTASVGGISPIISWLASLVQDTAIYQSLASVNGHLIVVKAGYRKEEVLNQLTKALNWNTNQQQQFMTALSSQTPGISDGMFAPGTYVVDNTMTPSNVAALMQVSFDRTILLHYSTTTAQQVPLPVALTVASLLEREAAGSSDMRIISGIIWNRLFHNMNLQIDATLQYAKATQSNRIASWWPQVLPKDKYIKSPYNTYANPGLPPGPIANPSVAAVIAALNPVPTSCLFYFHDKYGNFHCSDTYEQHVALLKKYYGQGK